jgi:DNA polymerase-3 subunit beta
MDFRIAKDELTRALGRVQGIVEKRSTNPIIANVLLEASGDGLAVSATDTEVSLQGRYVIECKSPGRITLGARQLFDIARQAPADSVSLSLQADGATVEIRSGRSNFKMLGLPASDFPAIADAKADGGIEIDAVSLKALVDKVIFSISGDDTRTGLNGAHVEAREDGDTRVLRLVSTDGHRLSLCGRPFRGEFAAPRSVLLPKKGLSELRRLLDADSAPWTVSFGATQAMFRLGTTSFSMRLLEGDFPDYQAVVPGRWQRRILLRKDDLVAALRRVSILASEKSSPVRFHIDGGSLTVSARQPELGEAKEEVEAQVDGEGLEVGFNGKYFLEALSALDADTASVEIGDSLSPCVLRPGEGSADELYVIMPMRLE